MPRLKFQPASSRQLRKKLKLSVSEWSRILHVTERTIYRWEREDGRATGTAGAVLAAIGLAVKSVPVAVVREAIGDGISMVVWTAIVAKSRK